MRPGYSMPVSIPKMVRLIVYVRRKAELLEPGFNSKDGAIDRQGPALYKVIYEEFQFQRWCD